VSYDFQICEIAILARLIMNLDQIEKWQLSFTGRNTECPKEEGIFI